MAYTNTVSAVAAVLFLAATIAPSLGETQSPMFQKMNTKCCSHLKSATKTQVTCLCDNYLPYPIVNITGLYSAIITTKRGVFDKFSCDSSSKARPIEISMTEEFKQLIVELQSGSTSWNYFPRRRILTSGHRMFNQHLLDGYQFLL